MVSWPWLPFPFSSSHFSLTTFSVSTPQFLLTIIFLHYSPTHSMSLSMQSPLQFRSSSPPFPLHFLGICSLCQLFICYIFYMTSQCAPRQFLLRTFLHSNHHCRFFHVLLSALLTPTIILIRLFSQTWTFPCCFSVSAMVSSAFMYASVIHELSTFPLRLRDMRLSSITPSTFVQAFVPAEILTKAINLMDFALGKCHFLSWIYKL